MRSIGSLRSAITLLQRRVRRSPTVGNDFLVPDRERGKTVHTSYALLCLRGAGGTRHPCVGRSAVSVGPPLALAAENQLLGRAHRVGPEGLQTPARPAPTIHPRPSVYAATVPEQRVLE